MGDPLSCSSLVLSYIQSVFNIDFLFSGDEAVGQFSEKKKARDPGDISLPLRVLQLLCEGHNQSLQNLLRVGGGSGIDLVHLVTEFFVVIQTGDIDNHVFVGL